MKPSSYWLISSRPVIAAVHADGGYGMFSIRGLVRVMRIPRKPKPFAVVGTITKKQLLK